MRRVLLLAFALCLFHGVEAQQQLAGRAGTFRQYSYPSDRFAIRSPQLPGVTIAKDRTFYQIYWNEPTDAVINFSVSRNAVDCSAWNAWAKSLQGNAVSATTVAGNLALESRGNRNALQDGYQLSQCTDGKTYSLESGWRKGESEPGIVGRVIKSFRLLDKAKS